VESYAFVDSPAHQLVHFCEFEGGGNLRSIDQIFNALLFFLGEVIALFEELPGSSFILISLNKLPIFFLLEIDF
jgi:hypothetical protein